MSKTFKRVIISSVVAAILAIGMSIPVLAANYDNNIGNPDNPGRGPAPNFGDGVSDGPGW
jgi:hypothetical protein